MRRALSETLCQVAEHDHGIVLVTGDLGYRVFDAFQQRFPDRYINVGVAEAQLIACAAGLALEGFHPIAYSIASFATGRPYEQIRYLIDYQALPVTIIGAGRGFVYGTSGVSHHALDDLGLMAGLPNMTVVVPGDPAEVRALLPHALRLSGPSYLTVGKFGESCYPAHHDEITLGQARLVQAGERVAIVCTGEIVHEVVGASQMLEDEGIRPLVYQMHTVKPLDATLLAHLSERDIRSMIVVDEHWPTGGLWSWIVQWYAGVSRDRVPDIVRLGPPHKHALGNETQDSYRRRFGYDASAIASRCRMAWEAA